MRTTALLACLALMAAIAVADKSTATTASLATSGEAGSPAPAPAPGSEVDQPDRPLSRQQRWVVFRPMFATRGRQRQLNRAWKNHELRRQSRPRQRGQRQRRALHFPSGGASSGEESGLALRVAVNDLLFQSAPANDLPEPSRGLRPMLLARLRGPAGPAAGPAAQDEEAFLLLSAAGGRPAIVPAPTTPAALAPAAPAAPHHKKQHANKHHKLHRKGDKQRRRVARDTTAAALSQRLDAMMAGSVRERGNIAERVKKYDAQGAYPAYTYTNGRYTRAAAAAAPSAAPAAPSVKVVKVKVHGEVDEDEEEEGMEAAESIVFRPLFAHRDRQAAKQQRRRLGFAKKSTKPAVKPLRRRPVGAAAAVPAKRPPAAAAYFHRRTYLKYPPRYEYSPYRRVVYYH